MYTYILQIKSPLDGAALLKLVQSIVYFQPDNKLVLDSEKQILPTLLLTLLTFEGYKQGDFNELGEINILLDQLLRLIFLS